MTEPMTARQRAQYLVRWLKDPNTPDELAVSEIERAILADRAAERDRLAQSGDVEDIAAEIIAILGIRLAGGIAPEPVIALARHVQARLAAVAEAARIEARDACARLLENDPGATPDQRIYGASRIRALRPDELEKKA